MAQLFSLGVIRVMKFMDIINIIAIITGPLFAVLITLWWQERKEKRDKKVNLFTMLLAYRKSYPVSPEWARGLNWDFPFGL